MKFEGDLYIHLVNLTILFYRSVASRLLTSQIDRFVVHYQNGQEARIGYISFQKARKVANCKNSCSSRNTPEVPPCTTIIESEVSSYRKTITNYCFGNADGSGLDITEGQFSHNPDYTCKCSCLFSCFLTCLELVWNTLPGLAKEHSQHIIDLINNSCIHSFNKHLYLAPSNSGIMLGTYVSGTKPKTSHILADGPEQEAERVDHKACMMQQNQIISFMQFQPYFLNGIFSIELHLLIKIYTHIMLSGASSKRFEVAFPLITSTNFQQNIR